jgi:hypothetical protein
MSMKLRCAAFGLALCGSTLAHAEFEFDLDLRLVESDGRRSFMEGGLGTLRFDAGDDGLQLGRARLAYRGAPAGNWHVVLDVSAWGAAENNVVDVTEAYAEWRPVPQSPLRSQVKVGAFYAPISLEHRARGWTNPYTISSSALNTWVGEELRTIGASYSLEWLGIANEQSFDAGLELAVFGWNDPAGVIIATRGWALHDRQTSLWGRVGTVPVVGGARRVIFHEIDDRPGLHVSGHLRHESGLELRALHYDNRGDPSVFDPGIQDFAWDTRFDSVGLRHESQRGTTVIAQALQGVTDAGPGPLLRWKYESAFVLLSQQWGRFRLSGRGEVFDMQQVFSPFPGALGDESGHAFTLAGAFELRNDLNVIAEWLYVDSTYNWRSRIGETPRAIERVGQIALRYSL